MLRQFTNSPTPGPPAPSRPVAIDPATLMINECMVISAAMRKMTRWLQSGVAAILGAGDIFGDDDSITTNLGLSSNLLANGKTLGGPDNPLLSSFLQLRSMLTEARDVYEIDSLTLLQPFLLVIKSLSTSGHITGLALNAVSKFLHYDIVSARSKNIQSLLIQIISSLTHCRFEAADQNSDDSVLLKVLRLLEVILESPLSSMLPNEVVSEVVQTCLSLACNKKRSEVLRRAAEMAMVSITFRIFSRLKDLEPESDGADELQTNFADTRLPEDIIGGTDKEGTPVPEKKLEADVSTDAETLADQTNVPLPEKKPEGDAPFDIVCINEFLGILISMISPSNQYQHMESTRVFALSLINTAVEVAGTDFPLHLSLMTLVSDPVSKHVLQIITTTDSPPLLQAALQLFSTIAIVLGRQLKSQIELTFNLLFRSILPEASNIHNDTIKGNETAVSNRIAASKEMLVESLSLLWTRSPVFFTHLFIDYDCDFDRTDLAIVVLDFLCNLSLPESALITTDNVPPICLEGVLSFISGINERIKSLPDSKDLFGSKPQKLIYDKKQKTSFVNCTNIFNEKPKDGIKALAESGFISSEQDITGLVKVFFHKSVRLNKKVLGEFLAKPSSIDILKEFMGLFEFSDIRVDEALRLLLKSFRLPGESQQIERIVEIFADRYVSCQSEVTDAEKDTTEEPVRPDRDSVFILSYSIILLNTDLHSPKVKKQMDLDAYKRNLRGVYNGKDYPEWYLYKIYHSIKDREIIMPEEHHGTDKWFDDVWHNLISSLASSNKRSKVSYGSTAEADLIQICKFDKVLFELVVDRIIDTLIGVFRDASDDHIITRLMSSIDKCANICLYYNLSASIDKLLGLLADLTSLTGKTHGASTSDDNLRDEIPITQIKIEKKEEAITVSEMAVWFGRDFKAQLSAVVLFRLIKKTDCKVTQSWNKVVTIILTLFENCLINPNLFGDFQRKIKLTPLSKVKPRYIINRVKPMKESGLLSTFSSFLKGYSDEPPEPSDQEVESTLSTMDCVRSVNVPSIFQTVSKGPVQDLKLFLHFLLSSLPHHSEETRRYFETETLFIIEVAVCFCLLIKELEVTHDVIDKIGTLLESKNISKKGHLRLNVYKLLLTRQSDSSSEESLNKTIQELVALDKEFLTKQGAQLIQPLISLVDDDSWCVAALLNNEDYWKLLRIFGSIPLHAPDILKFIGGIVKHSPKEITAQNFTALLGALDEVSSLGAIGSQWEQDKDLAATAGKKLPETADSKYFKDLIEESKKSISLTAELASILGGEEFDQKDMAYSLVQALAHQCFNPCRETRAFAVKTLQLTVLSSEVNANYTPYGIFEYGLFPLLAELSKVEVIQTDPNGFNATQVETLSLVSKVFLNHQTQFSTEETSVVWLGILDNFLELNKLGEQFNKSNNLIKESGPELLKNMILVLQSAAVLSKQNPELWESSRQKIGGLYPQLEQEFFAEPTETVPEEEKAAAVEVPTESEANAETVNSTADEAAK